MSDPLAIGALGMAAMFALILIQVPIGIAMIVVGVVGFALQSGWGPALSILAGEPSGILSSVDLASVPLFLMMGTFATAAGFSADIYAAAYNRDPDFYRFLKSMGTLRESIDPETTLILSTDSELLRYLNSAK